MTWVLYFYDSDGAEIGWVETDPYTFSITHPDGPEQYGWIRFRLRRLESPVIKSGAVRTVDDGRVMDQMYDSVDVSGKEKLEYIEDEIGALEGVGSTALVDE
jgi:hypothetical protein